MHMRRAVLRQFNRKLLNRLSSDASPFRLRALIRYLEWAKERFGLSFALRTGTLWALGLTSTISAPAGHGVRVALRPGTPDLFVYDEVFRTHAYDMALAKAPRFIVDAGGHIGLTSVRLAQQYPDSKILCIEPEPANVAIAQRNAGSFPNVTVVHAALWSHTGRVAIANPSAASWSFRVKTSRSGVQAYSMMDLLSPYGFPRIDLLKLDIEGAEDAVLADCESQLHHVGAIVMDLHEFAPALRQAPRVLERLTRAGFTYAIDELVPLPWREPVAGDLTPFPGKALNWAMTVRAWRNDW